MSRDCLALRFAKPRGFTYGPGDWLDIRFPTPEFPVGRTYSFASAPTEPDLLIAFTVRYVPTATAGRLTKRKRRAMLPAMTDGQRRSYVAGPPGMVDATETLLRILGGAPEAIKTDRFDGY